MPHPKWGCVARRYQEVAAVDIHFSLWNATFLFIYKSRIWWYVGFLDEDWVVGRILTILRFSLPILSLIHSFVEIWVDRRHEVVTLVVLTVACQGLHFGDHLRFGGIFTPFLLHASCTPSGRHNRRKVTMGVAITGLLVLAAPVIAGAAGISVFREQVVWALERRAYSLCGLGLQAVLVKVLFLVIWFIRGGACYGCDGWCWELLDLGQLRRLLYCLFLKLEALCINLYRRKHGRRNERFDALTLFLLELPREI